MQRIRVQEALEETGYHLQAAQASQYSYDATVTGASLLFVSGQIPKVGDKIAWQGVVGTELSVADGVKAAEICAVNVLSQVDTKVGFERIARLMKIVVYVASSDDFLDQPAVAEGASKLMLVALGEDGKHARTAIGVPRLPKNATVEVEAVFALND